MSAAVEEERERGRECVKETQKSTKEDVQSYIQEQRQVRRRCARIRMIIPCHMGSWEPGLIGSILERYILFSTMKVKDTMFFH